MYPPKLELKKTTECPIYQYNNYQLSMAVFDRQDSSYCQHIIMNNNIPSKLFMRCELVRVGRICGSLYSSEIGTISLQQNLLSRAFAIQDCIQHSRAFPDLMLAFLQI